MTKEQLIATVTAHYEELDALNKIDNFYDYEGGFIKLWSKLGRDVLEKNISELPGDRRKKNSNRFRGAVHSQKPPVQRSGKRVSNKPPHATDDGILRAVGQLREKQ